MSDQQTAKRKPTIRTQDRYRDAAGSAWKWTRKGWRLVRWHPRAEGRAK
jgi:hypothetical protein